MLNLVKNVLNREHPVCTAIVPAAGSSSRMGGIDKLFAVVGRRPILAHTLRALQQTSDITHIVIASQPENFDRIRSLAAEHGIDKLYAVVPGGDSRGATVQAALAAVPKDTELVAVHDAARPFATPTLIGFCVRLAARTHAALPCVPVKDTVKTVSGDIVTGTPDRSILQLAQTPQVFQRHLLEAAYAKAEQEKLAYTDDASVVEAFGMTVHTCRGDYENIKITTPEDLILAEAIWKGRTTCASDTDTTSIG